MTPEKILEVVEGYEKLLQKKGAVKKKFSANNGLCDLSLGRNHCYAMLDEIVGFVKEGRIEKAFRWLGFIQGCLWTQGICTLDDLKNANKP